VFMGWDQPEPEQLGINHFHRLKSQMVPRVGIEPTLLAERDFESRASTNFTTEAGARRCGFCHKTKAPSRAATSNRNRVRSRHCSFLFAIHFLARRITMPPLPPITQALLLLNVGIFCLNYLMQGWLFKWFALFPLVADFWPWQLVSYSFLHGSLTHLFFNMMGLWMFGNELERLWGPKRFITYYLVSVLVAALTHMLIQTAMGSHGFMVGASGGIFGLLLAYGMMFPNRTIMPLIPPIPMKAKVYVAVFGGLELLFGVTGTNDGIAHFAHLGGMLGGYLVIRYWRGQAPFGKRR
jgi:membrane associated rhomboid family serine protease